MRPKQSTSMILLLSSLAMFLASCGPAWAKEGNVIALPEGNVKAWHLINEGYGLDIESCSLPGNQLGLITRETYWNDFAEDLNDKPWLLALAVEYTGDCGDEPLIEAKTRGISRVDPITTKEMLNKYCEGGVPVACTSLERGR